MRGLLVAANQQPELAGVFTTYAADTPQIYLDIDRDKAQVLGVKVSDIFNALQSTLGGFYVNDFNLFGRTWQVNVQAEAPLPRRDRRHLPRLRAQQRPATWCRCGRWRRRELVQGPQALIRYNGFRAAVINGAPKPGYSSGQALAAMERISATTLPAGYGFEWTGTALAGEGGERPDRHRARPRRAVRLSVPGGALRELEHPDAGAAVGQRRRARRDRRRWPGRASPSTSMPRSASSC